MAELHYLISDASKKVDVEAHVLRYWEDELELSVPRNEMGHRYYTDYHIRLFRQVKALKEKGYQLKAIKAAFLRLPRNEKIIIPGEVLEANAAAALEETGEEENIMKSEKENTEESRDLEKRAEENLSAPVPREAEPAMAEEKLLRLQQLMNRVIGQAMEENREQLSREISSLLHEKFMKEAEYLIRVSDEKEEERFRRLDDAIRSCQRELPARSEAAAACAPFSFFRIRKKKFGRNGNKLS